MKPFVHSTKTILLLLFFVVCNFAAGNFAVAAIEEPTATQPQILKSENDKREYRYLTLSNELKVLLISDPTADKSAASLDVNVGSSDDPAEREGLAHFLEHMLFLGTKKYPQAGEYQKFLDSNGGGHNAYTSYDHTNYFFDIDPSKLGPTLDRFAQFFISPLFTEKYVDREKHAVDSEYKAKIKDDYRRRDEIFKLSLNQKHPLAKFSVGSLEIFAEKTPGELRTSLLDFYNKHYSSNIMGLVVLGKESLDDLQKMVEQKFSAVPNRHVKIQETQVSYYEPGKLPLEAQMVPDKELRVLSFDFPIPPQQAYYRAKPLQYIGNIIGHEGKGSLLSMLKKQGYAEGLSAGIGRETPDGAFFSVGITLTENGEKHIDEIGTLLFQTLNRIREKGPQPWLYEEGKTMADITFRFQEKFSAITYVSDLASSIHEFSPEDLLRGDFMMEEYRPELIAELLHYIIPANMLVTLVAPDIKPQATSPYYAAPYALGPMAKARLDKWKAAGTNEEIQLPTANEFLPQHVELFALDDQAKQQEKPILLKETEGLQLWYQQDKQFRVPRGDLYFTIRSPLPQESVEYSALMQLYVALVRDQLNEFGYPANLAGLSYDVSKHVRGYSVEIHGYTEKQLALLKKMAEALTQFKIDPQRFNDVKSDLVRLWRNDDKKIPYEQVIDDINHVLYKVHWTDAELADSLENKTPLQLRTFVNIMLERGVSIEGLMHGNYQKEEAFKLAEVMDQALLKGKKIPTIAPVDVAVLDGSKTLLRPLPVDHADSAVIWYLQGDDQSATSRAQLSLVSQILKTSYYQELRTEKQLGYIVFNGGMPLLDVPGIVFVVQSPNTLPDALVGHIHDYMQRQVAVIKSMGEKQFKQHKESLITLISEEPKNLNEQSERLWQSIILKDYGFDRREKLLEAVGAISYQDFIKYYNRTVGSNSPRDLWAYTQKPDMHFTALTPDMNGSDIKSTTNKSTEVKSAEVKSSDKKNAAKKSSAIKGAEKISLNKNDKAQPSTVIASRPLLNIDNVQQFREKNLYYELQ